MSSVNGGEFWQGAGQGAIWGFGIGFTTGAYTGYREARAQGVDPWTNKSKVAATEKLTPNEKGEQGVQKAITEIESKGGTVLGREITLEVNGVRVRVDLAADFNGEIHLIEVKNGPSAGFTQNQKIVYPQMLDGAPVIFKGGNAQKSGFDINVPTTTYILKIIKY
jgi:hypothetical protein